MPVFTSIAAGIAAISTWTIGLGSLGTFAVGNFILRTAAQIGIGLIAASLAGKGQGKSDPFSIKGQISAGGNVPRSFMLGPSLTAGSLVWHSEWGKAGKTPNAYYTQVIALSDVPVAGLNRVFVNGAAVTLDAVAGTNGRAVLEYRVEGKDHQWIRFHDGNQTTADPFLTGTVSPLAVRPYEATRIGTGIAYAVVTTLVNQKLFTGFPSFKFVLDGVPLYDISRDSTQGGAGAQRWDDRSTWGGDGDALPAVQAYNLTRGITVNGVWIYGLQGVSAARIPAAHWIAQIEKCRAPIAAASGFEPAYRSAGEVFCGDELGRTFERILTTCSGRYSEIAGAYKIFLGAPDAAVFAFTDGDIISTAPQSMTPFNGLADRVNGITGTYPSPDEGYVARATPPIYRPDYEAEDGGRRLLVSVSLDFVPFEEQAQRLMATELAAARRARRHTLTLPARFYRAEPGDVVSWVSVRNGYTEKLFRIDGVLDLPNCDVMVDLTEVDPADHGSWISAQHFVAPVLAPITLSLPPAQEAIGITFNGAAVVGLDGGDKIPAIRAAWLSDLEDVVAVEIQVSEAVSGSVVASVRLDAVDLTEGLISSGILPRTTYLVRGRYVSDTARPMLWGDPVSVMSLGVGVPLSPVIDGVRLSAVPSPARVIASVDISHAVPASVASYSVTMVSPLGVQVTLQGGASAAFDFTLDPSVPGSYGVFVTAYGFTGEAADIAEADFVFSRDILVPDPVAGFRSRIMGDLAYLTWNAGGDLVDHYQIRHLAPGAGTGWGQAVDIERDLVGRTAAVPALPGSYLIKAVSVFGYPSPSAIVITSTISSLSAINVVKTLAESPGFPGAKSDGLAVSAGALRTMSVAPLSSWAALSDVALIGTFGGVVSSGTYGVSEIVDLTETYSVRLSARVAGHGLLLDNLVSGWDPMSALESLSTISDESWEIILRVRTTADDPASGAAVWSPWDEFYVGDYVARGFEFEVDLISKAAAVSVRLTELSITIDMPDRVEAGEDVTCPPGGVFVSFSPPFRERPAIAVDGQGLPSGAQSVRTNVSRAGFHQKFVSGAGADLSCSFDWVSKGYGRAK
jgi:putative tail protein